MESLSRSAVLSRLPVATELVDIRGETITLRMRFPLETAKRGKLLLDFEKRLHKEVARRAVVLLEPMGDMEKLRKRLRGVVIK